MKKTCNLTCIALFILAMSLASSLQAQKKYGFEWLRPYMPYLKIKLIDKGIYRLDSAAMQAAGFSLVGLNPNRLQVFRDGVELPIFLQGATDNVFNANDYVAFYSKNLSLKKV